MIGMALFAITVTVGGYFTDKGIPKVRVVDTVLMCAVLKEMSVHDK